MPYPNEHAARIKEPGQFTSFARKTISEGVDLILGIKEGKSETQAYRFSKKKFTPEEAKKWLKDNNVDYMSFEQATDKKEYEEDEKMTYDIPGVPVFRVGKWNGDVYTEEDFDNIAHNYKLLSDRYKPKMKLGHSPDQKLAQKDGYPAIGGVSNVRREGKELVVDLNDVPGKIYTLIKTKAYNSFSPEIAWNVKDQTGNTYRRVLKGLALLGADVPACSIDDYIKLYEDNFINGEVKIYNENDFGKENQMDPKDKEIEELKKYKENSEKENGELKKYKEEIDKKLSEKDSEIKKILDSQKEQEVKLYVENKVKEGKILPSQKQAVIALAIDIQANDKGEKIHCYSENNESKELKVKSNLDLVKIIFDNAEKQVNYSEKSEHNEPERKSHVNEEHKEYADLEKKVDDLITEYKKNGKTISYKDAIEIVRGK